MNRFKPLSLVHINAIASQAVTIYHWGPTLKALEPVVIDDYYKACSNAMVLTIGMAQGIQCSFTNQLRYFTWNYACTMLSTFY